MKTQLVGDYLTIPVCYGNETAMLFIPKSFIERGDLNLWKVQPDNLFGVNLQAVLKQMENHDQRPQGTSEVI